MPKPVQPPRRTLPSVDGGCPCDSRVGRRLDRPDLLAATTDRLPGLVSRGSSAAPGHALGLTVR